MESPAANIAASVYTNSRARLPIVAEPNNILPSTTNSRSKRIGTKGTLTNPQEKKKINGNPAGNKTYLIWYERKSGMLMTMVNRERCTAFLISSGIITTYSFFPDPDSIGTDRVAEFIRRIKIGNELLMTSIPIP
jgi:hypothetical protein